MDSNVAHFTIRQNGSAKKNDYNDEAIAGTNAYSEVLEHSYVLKDIQIIEKRWTVCIELKNDYGKK